MVEDQEPQGAENGTVEGLLEEIANVAGSGNSDARFELWVPKNLTLEGEVVSLEAAMAILTDAILANNYVLDGFSESPQGRVYKYVRADATGRDSDERAFSLPLTWILLFAIIAGFLIILYR